MSLYNRQNVPQGPGHNGRMPLRFLTGGMRNEGQPERQYSGSNMFNPTNEQSAGSPTGSAPAIGGNHQSAYHYNPNPNPTAGAKGGGNTFRPNSGGMPAQNNFQNNLPMFSRGGK